MGALGGGGPHQVLINKVLKLGNLFFLLFVMLHFRCQAGGLVFNEGRVVSRVVVEGLVIEVVHFVDHPVQEVTVVRDNQKGARVAL